MKTNRPLHRRLRHAALVLLVAGPAVWAVSGARLGWTQTSAVTMRRDEITGIDYPVRHPAFLPGVEIPLLATFAAAALAGLSLLPRRAAQKA